MYRCRPFPLGVKGGFYELDEGSRTRFFEIHSVEYDPDKIEYLKKIGSLNDAVIGEYLKNINHQQIDNSTFFLYKLITYYADPTISDQLDFGESIFDYEQHFFAEYDNLREYCIQRWKVDSMGFVRREDTNIP